MNTGLLQKRGCYICTSLLEVGTSIKGIIDEHGTVFQPETLVPVFVCLQPTDSDTDAMEQFFARPRFKFNRAMILMNLPESRMYSAERMSLDRIMGVVWAEAQHNADILNEDQQNSRLMVTRMNGRDETELVTYNGTEYVVDLNEVIAKGYTMQDMLIYMFPSETVHMLEDRFKVPVSQTIESGTKPYNFNKNRELPEALTNEIEKIKNGEGSVTMDRLKDIIMNPVGGQSTESSLERLRNCGRESGNPEDESIGMSYIRLLQQYLGCPIYSLKVAMDLAAQKLANPHRRPVNPVTDQKIDFKLDSQHGMFSIMSKFTQVQQDYFIDAYDIWHNPNSSRASAYDKSNPLFLFPTEDHFCLSANMDSPMLKDFMILMKRHRHKLNWRQVCLGAMHMCEEEFHGYVQSLTYVPWNKMECGSNAYLMAVQPNTSVIGAEYDILRNPQKSFYYYDYETEMQLSVNPDYAKAENFPGKKVFFADGLIGKTLTDHDLESMAKCMNQAVNYRCPSAKLHTRYTAAQMYYTIKAVFIVEETKTADGILLEIVGLRQRAIRLNAPDKDATTEMRQNMFREIDEAMIDIRYDKAAKRSRVELILNKGLATSCFTRKFVDACISELSKCRTYGTWVYDFDYQVGMVQAMYDLIEKHPDEPCTLEEINRTNFGTKGVMAYDEYTKLDAEMMCMALPQDFHERELTAEEQLQLKAFSIRKEQLTLIISERCEIMKQAKAATEKAFADDCIIFETADYGIGRNGLIAKFREPKPVTTEQALAFVTQEPKGPGNEEERLAG